MISLAAILDPLAFSVFYLLVQQQWPGAVWLSVVVVNLLIIPIVFYMRTK